MYLNTFLLIKNFNLLFNNNWLDIFVLYFFFTFLPFFFLFHPYDHFDPKRILGWNATIREVFYWMQGWKVHQGAWVAQVVKCPTLDLSSGLDLRVISLSPALGSVLGVEAYFKKKKKSAHRRQVPFPQWETAGHKQVQPRTNALMWGRYKCNHWSPLGLNGSWAVSQWQRWLSLISKKVNGSFSSYLGPQEGGCPQWRHSWCDRTEDSLDLKKIFS